VTERVFDNLCEIVDRPSTPDSVSLHQNLQLVAQQVITDGELSCGLITFHSGYQRGVLHNISK